MTNFKVVLVMHQYQTIEIEAASIEEAKASTLDMWDWDQPIEEIEATWDVYDIEEVKE